MDFHSQEEYAYNKNGAMTKDLNKGISAIEYNCLNLPRLMDIKSPIAEARNEYTYTASGDKLRVVSKWNTYFSTNPLIGSDVNPSLLTKSKTTDYVGNKVYENGVLKRILVDDGYIENGVYYFYLTDHLGNNRAVAKADGNIVQRTQYYPFGMAFADGQGAGVQPYKYGNKELDADHGLMMYDYSARYYNGISFTSIDPLAEKYYSISPYVYCANNPMRYVDPTGMVLDDYYSSLNGKHLGNDNGIPGRMRLIDENKYSDIKNSSKGTIVDRMNSLQAEGKLITIDNTKIQSDLQAVANLSSTPNANGDYQEHQLYLTLDRNTATISSTIGEAGTHNRTTLTYYPAPSIDVNFLNNPLSVPKGPVIIGQAHGHPPTNIPGYLTAKTMSRDFDVPTSASINAPIYALDAMNGSTKGNPTAIHRVTPTGTITNNVGKTSSGFNIGRDAMQIWGKRR